MTTNAPLGGSAPVFSAPVGLPSLTRGPLMAMAPPADEGPAADPGPMSRAEAVAAVVAMEAPVEAKPKPAPVAAAAAVEADQDEQESEAGPTAEDQGDPETAIVEEEAEQIDPETAIDFPRSWAAEDREVFAALPEEARKVILAREDVRDRAVSKAQQEAATARQRAEQEAEQLSKLRPQLEGVVARANKAFADKWEGVTEADWARWAEEDPGETMKLKLRHDAEKAELHRAQTVAAELETADIQKFVETEFAKLPEIAPDLVDPKEGAKRRTALARFLVEDGVATFDQLKHVSAKEMGIAYDAMRYRQLKAAPPKPKTPNPAASTPPVRPAASDQRSPSNDVDRARNRFNQTGKREDAVAYLKKQGL